jgi:predicted oxidoreductase
MEIRARRGVVLASGGFGANAAWRQRYMPLAEAHISVQPDTNIGDGIRLAQAAGGALGPVNPDNGVWAPVSILRHADGRIDKYPHFGPDRGKPGSLIVDQSGQRFVNEAAPYQVFGQAMHAHQITKAWFIGNRRFLRQYGMGLALPAPYPIGRLLRAGYLEQAPTIAELARKIAIDPAALTATLDEFNHYARQGKDPAFHRGDSVYDASQGDFTHKPNPNLAPIEGGPWYALALYPGDVSSVLGLETNIHAQVLTPAGAVVEGLYAVGLDQNTVMRGTYPGGGAGIGPAMTFGYIAGKHLAAG